MLQESVVVKVASTVSEGRVSEQVLNANLVDDARETRARRTVEHNVGAQ